MFDYLHCYKQILHNFRHLTLLIEKNKEYFDNRKYLFWRDT